MLEFGVFRETIQKPEEGWTMTEGSQGRFVDSAFTEDEVVKHALKTLVEKALTVRVDPIVVLNSTRRLMADPNDEGVKTAVHDVGAVAGVESNDCVPEMLELKPKV